MSGVSNEEEIVARGKEVALAENRRLQRKAVPIFWGDDRELRRDRPDL
jgi:hypothetical protein